MSSDSLFGCANLIRISGGGQSFIIDCKGHDLIFPTGNSGKIEGNNEYTLDPYRYQPGGTLAGTEGGLYTPTSGISLADKAGGNTGSSISAATLSAASSLAVNETEKTITEEFIVENTNAQSSGATVLDDCSLTSGWSIAFADNGALSSVDGKLVLSGKSNASNRFRVTKNFGSNLSGVKFLKFDITSSVAGTLYFEFRDVPTNYYMAWRLSRYTFTANETKTLIFPLQAAISGTTGILPNTRSSGTFAYTNSTLYIGVDPTAGAGTVMEIKIDNIVADPGTDAVLEIESPSIMAINSATVYSWDGSAYQQVGTYKLNSTYEYVSGTPGNLKYLSGDTFDNLIGSGLGRAIFPKGKNGDTVTGSTGTITYSSNNPGKNRIGLKINLPPVSGTTNANKSHFKIVFNYVLSGGNSGAATLDFVKTEENALGLLNLAKPWIGILKADGEIEYYIFSDIPKSITAKRDADNVYYQVAVDPGNAQVLRGVSQLGNLTADSNADYIPDSLTNYFEAMLSGFGFNDSGFITFQTTGATFAPLLTVDTGAIIEWKFGDGSTSDSANPSVNFGGAATRNNTLRVIPWGALREINIGYTGVDEGDPLIPLVGNQNVSKITGLFRATSLKLFCAAENPLTYADFSDLINLETIECYNANLSGIGLRNVPGLKRLVIETNLLHELNLSEALNLEDLRGAANANPYNIIWGSLMSKLWHICIHSNNFSTPPGFPDLDIVPNLVELLIYGEAQPMALNLKGSKLSRVRAQSNTISSITISDNCTALKDLYLTDCGLSQAIVDYVLERLDSLGCTSGVVYLAGTNAAPSSTGAAHWANLQGKGWVGATN